MLRAKTVLTGCCLAPALLLAGVFGKIWFDWKTYELPGKTLQSDATPTSAGMTAQEVAEALDSYVQPRFAILRDKNFGALRIAYRKHAGIVQLKVDSRSEKQIIANVNAARRDYIICLLHCAPKPPYNYTPSHARLDVLYANQQRLVSDMDYPSGGAGIALRDKPDLEELREDADKDIAALRAGQQVRETKQGWLTLMRPVQARSERCLSCHTEARSGSTLGVMVYCVRAGTGREKIANLKLSPARER